MLTPTETWASHLRGVFSGQITRVSVRSGPCSAVDAYGHILRGGPGFARALEGGSKLLLTLGAEAFYQALLIHDDELCVDICHPLHPPLNLLADCPLPTYRGSSQHITCKNYERASPSRSVLLGVRQKALEG